MSKETSVAPKERVNIVYQPATGNAQEQVELPLKILMMGDFTGKPDDRPLEERAPINVDKDNFTDVMGSVGLTLSLSVPNRLQDGQDELSAQLKFKNLNDFTPEGIAHQVPELQKLLELRDALSALKSPLGNRPEFRKRIQAILADAGARERMSAELKLDRATGAGPVGED
jgi:type VI secretion system protein ImpB